MSKEIIALEANQIYDFATLPLGKKPISCRWVYRIKYHADGSIKHYKTRLVARGLTQITGLDFHDTYAPMAKLVIFRCLLATVVSKE